MSTAFPLGLDSLSNPGPTNKQNSPSHSSQHANANDAIEALEAKVGVNGSSNPDSLDYKIANLETSNAPIIIAASDAPAIWQSSAVVVCDGSADDVTIQNAINTYGKVRLSPGTFDITATLNIDGNNDVDAAPYFLLTGAGLDTILDCSNNVNGISLTDVVRAEISDLAIAVRGSGNGIVSISSSGTTHRSFYNSTFRNIYIYGDFSTHTGWAMSLGSPFRSVFENIEVAGTKNGIKLFSEYSDFNPGDCTFTRCFVEISAAAAGVAYHLSGPSGLGIMNQCTFNMCEAIANNSGSTGILLDGAVGADWNRFWGTNLEQFTTPIDVSVGEGNIFECNYVEPAASGTVFHAGTAAQNNRFSSVYVYTNQTIVLFDDDNTVSDINPNRLVDTKILADTGSTITITAVDGSIIENVTYDGGGTVPDFLTYRQGPVKIAAGPLQSESMLEVANQENSSSSTDSVYIHDHTDFAYAGNLLKLENKNSSDTGAPLLIKNAAASSKSIKVTDGSNNDKFTVDQSGNTVNAGTLTSTGGVIANGGITNATANHKVPFIVAAAQQALSGAGAINLTTHYTAWTTTGANAGTLANATRIGHLKKIQLIVDGGDGTLTPTSLAGGTTITFADVGDYAILMWNGASWTPIELGNNADGSTAPVLA